MKAEKKSATFIAPVFCISVILFFAVILLNPTTRDIFVKCTVSHPYILGFIKFGLLATTGELLARRLSSGTWSIPVGVLARAIIWGVLGMAITLVFKVYGGGIKSAMGLGYLPGGESVFLKALFTSVIMNISFAPVMMAFHRITDTWIDMRYKKESNITLSSIVTSIDWAGFVDFTILKTIPLFWIPAHTITFLLPGEYQIMMAAFLSIALGAILASTAKQKRIKY